MFTYAGQGKVGTSQLILDVQMYYGRVEVLVSNTEKNPCESTLSESVTKKIMYGGIGGKISLDFTNDQHNSFYVCVRNFNKQSSLGLSIRSKYENSIHHNSIGNLNKIPSNMILFGEIDHVDSPLLFTFDYPASDTKENITIHLNSLSGDSVYRIIVTNNGQAPSKQ